MSPKMGNYIYCMCVKNKGSASYQFNSITVFKRKKKKEREKEQKDLQHYYVLNLEKVQPCMNQSKRNPCLGEKTE